MQPDPRFAARRDFPPARRPAIDVGWARGEIARLREVNEEYEDGCSGPIAEERWVGYARMALADPPTDI